MTREIFTIGHSNHSIEFFIQLLNKHLINAVCDVRSFPYSRFNHQYSRESLEDRLESENIAYEFLGKELGGRTSDKTCYVDGKVQFDRLAKTALFKNGLNRLIKNSQKHRISLLCAEKDPLQCHRAILISPLVKEELSVHHIKEDGALETHRELESRLLESLISPNDLFPMNIDDAYRFHGARIAFQDENERSLNKNRSFIRRK